MKMEDISTIIGGISEELIEEVSAQREKEFFEARDKKRRSIRWTVKIALPIAACIAVIVAIPGIISSFGDGIVMEKPSDKDTISTEAPSDDMGSGSGKPTAFGKIPAKYQSSYDSDVKLESVKTLAAAQYPACAEFPDYSDQNADYMLQQRIYDEFNGSRISSAKDIDKYSDFYDELISSALTDCNDENRVISPVNLYIAASMLAEISDGETRRQILGALNVSTIDELRENAEALWNSNYIYDRTRKQLLSSSLWLNEGVKFKKSAIKALSEHYYADSFSGDFGDPGLTSDMQKWLSKRTGGLLEEQIGDVSLDESMIMDILTTVYFSAKWKHEFSPKFNERLIFHSPSGDVEADFMCQSDDDKDYYRGESCGAIYKDFEGGGRMWLILPDEGRTVSEVFSQESLIESILDGKKDSAEQVMLNLKLPKFDVSSDIDISNSFKAMGIENAFDLDAADFSALTNQSPVYVSNVNHAARVVIDEEGCKAAAFTVIEAPGAAPWEEKKTIDFILDRPFIFIIESDVGQPLFIGVVNNV